LGSFWTGDADQTLQLPAGWDGRGKEQELTLGGPFASISVIRFTVDEHNEGLFILRSRHAGYFDLERVGFYEAVAQTLGLGVADRRAQAAHRQSVKELSCLYDIARLTSDNETPLAEILQAVVDTLPSASRFPDSTCATLTFDGTTYRTPSYCETRHTLTADLLVAGETRGDLTIGLLGDDPQLEESPFVPEEKSLLDTVVQHLALLLEKRQSAAESARLEAQLRHADRLATIGQLSAGVAHELNEPLNTVLGLAQLARKQADLPDQVASDLESIATASLQARRIIRQLMTFARQTPPNKTPVDLNQIVRDGLALVESRCVKAGITLAVNLAEELPVLTLDAVQMNQVLVNLIVNAIQAMPEGGTLTVRTETREDAVCLSVEDTGTGMSDHVMASLFLPFFTTKDVNEGTGLGLSVVYGIVAAHAGAIGVESELGRGSRFDVRLPVST
jgi:signal transduction histidine kinase